MQFISAIHWHLHSDDVTVKKGMNSKSSLSLKVTGTALYE